MKVLLMHHGDGDNGGAQVQMNRLRAGLVEEGVDARVLCRQKTRGESVLMPFRPRAERWIGRLTRSAGLNDIELISSFAVPGISEVREADVLDIHCLHSGTFSYLALPALTAAKPTVFTFHDMWPITGHCHASLECERWKTGCGSCPHLDTHPAVRRDATAWEWKLKNLAYGRSSFTIVTPSKWLADRTEQSLLAGRKVLHIPHGVDTEIFQPLDKQHCRSLLGLPEGKTVLLCAMESRERPLKGAELLAAALAELPEAVKQDSVLLLFGNFTEEILRSLPMQVFNLGYLRGDDQKAVAYSAADLLINPSRAESFGLVVLESMACGTPVASFRVGGVPELVRPGLTGSLAEPNQSGSLAREISHLLSDPEKLITMGSVCRETVLREFPLRLQVQRYKALYESLAMV